MPAAAARRAGRGGPPTARAGLGRDGSETRRSARSRAQQSLEQRMLLTATLCLLAFGAVMVYSASSATTLLQGRGNGSGYLVRYLVYGSIGLLIMRLLARDGVRFLTRITGPLLGLSFVLVLAVHVPHIGVSVNGARRWLGTGPLQFQPSELMKLALVLYAAALLARRPQRVHDLRELVNPLVVVVAAAVLLIGTQPDLGTALVIAFTVTAILVAAGVSLRTMAVIAGAPPGEGAARPLQRAARGWRHLADRLAGAPEHMRRARAGAAHGRAPAVRLLRIEQPHRDAGEHGPVDERRRGRQRARAAAACVAP